MPPPFDFAYIPSFGQPHPGFPPYLCHFVLIIILFQEITLVLQNKI